MRKAFADPGRLDCPPVSDVVLNFNCRDELVPILAALQHVYGQPNLRDEILELVADDVTADVRDDRGREGMNYWQIVVLAAVRLGCNLDYDKLQDLAEQHRALRLIMGIGDWEDSTDFSYRRIRDNICLLRPATIESISHLIVGAGHEIEPEAAEKVRIDSFVVETNIHYPSESSLLYDGTRLLVPLCAALALVRDLSGWRQHEHLVDKVKKLARQIARTSSRKGPKYKKRLKSQYRQLLKKTKAILKRAHGLDATITQLGPTAAEQSQLEQLRQWIKQTEQVWETAHRRVVRGETVPNDEKLFSFFEPHTQLYKRGKASTPIQFGRQLLICEDVAGLIVHHHLLPRDANDRDVVVEQTKLVQHRLDGRIEEASFDRGFHSPENQEELAEIVEHPCLPKPGVKQAAKQQAEAGVRFREARERHPGIESAIGALQQGNGLKRCRDRGEVGFDRYLALAILGRNLHTLGKMLLARHDAHCEAAQTRRQAA